MTEQILDSLQKLGIQDYYINEKITESVECFFIRKKLDLKRLTDVAEYEVAVYHSFEKDGRQMLGSSVTQIYPGMEEEELREALQGAYDAAGFVCNPYYELIGGKKEDFVPADSDLAGMTLEEGLRTMAEALFASDTEDTVFINSAELFADRTRRRIVNSRGIDVSFETCQVSGEYVVQCTDPQDVETYHHFLHREADTESLRREVEEALAMTRARAQAVKAPKAGEYRIILSGEHVRTLLSYYVSRAGSGMIYRKYSNYQIGMAVQGENIKGDALTILLKAIEPYSEEGIPMKDRILLEDGTLQTIHGGVRFARYLGIEPTGTYRSIAVPTGRTAWEDMKKEPYLHIVSFSDFQMDDFSGYFGGEIRLAFFFDGKTVTPVTGGSVNGSIFKVQENLVFSRERYRNGRYEGPFAVSMDGVSVAGE